MYNSIIFLIQQKKSTRKNYKHKMHIHLKLFLFPFLDFVVSFKLKFTSLNYFDIRFTFIGTDHSTFRGEGVMFFLKFCFNETKIRSFFFNKKLSFKTTRSNYRYLILHVACQDYYSMEKWNGRSPRFNISITLHTCTSDIQASYRLITLVHHSMEGKKRSNLI